MFQHKNDRPAHGRLHVIVNDIIKNKNKKREKEHMKVYISG